MPDFKKTNRFSKPGGFKRPTFGSGPRRPAGRDFGNTETFKATCSKCNNSCDVPFRPNGKKPVFCKDCFVRDDARPQTGGYEKRSYNDERPSYNPKPAVTEDPRIGAMQKELAVVHAKLDTLIERLEGAAFSSIIEKASERAEKPVKTKAAAKKAAKK
ncbi:MAG: hypothetical protein AB199_01585 [Parcubacteria bacterium C7867-004]|nr:MAG: hypothetical protein AB199_01585 [Parcubacteria bacterium C7867-004]